MVEMKACIVESLKKRISIAFLGVMAILLCVGLVKMLGPKDTYSYQGSQSFTVGTAEERVVYSGLALPPGVYEVHLDYVTDVTIGNHCIVVNAGEERMLTNGENLYAGAGRTGYLMWLYEKAESLEIRVSYDGEGNLTTGNLTIRETPLAGSRLLLTVLGVLLVFGAVIVWRAYEKAYGFAPEQKKAFVAVSLIALAASLPFCLGKVFFGGDLIYHLHRIEGIMDGILSGQFPVRLEPEWVHGHGYANGVFYCGTLLVFPALLRMAGFTITAGYSVFCVGLNFATAWITYGCFGKIFKDRTIGIICSALYTLSIMRFYRLLYTSAVGEASAMTFLPLILCGFYLVFSEKTDSRDFKRAWIYLGAGYASLIQSHVLTCEITAFLTIFICLVMIRRVFQKERFLELAKGALSALGVSAWFLVPFLDYYINEDLHIKHVAARTIQERGLHPLQLGIQWSMEKVNALFGGSVVSGPDPVGLGFLLMLAFGIFVLLWVFGVWRREKGSIVILGKISGILAALLMLMSLRSFPWNRIQALHPVFASLVSSLQFPNRFLGWGTLFGVVLAGCCVMYFKGRKKQIYYVVLACCLLGIISSYAYSVSAAVKYKTALELYNVEGIGRGYISGAEYLREGVVGETLVYRAPVVSETVELTAYEKGSLSAVASCKNNSAAPGSVDVPLLLYKGYRAEDVDTGEKLGIGYGSNGTICVEIPGGYNGTFRVEFVPPWYWRVSEVLSLLSIVGVLFAIRRKVVYTK